MSADGIEIKSVVGRAIAPWIADLARLRITVFRDYPYLYDGSASYEEKYLQTYVDSDDSVVVLALDGGTVVGASTGLPMEHETDEFKQPFVVNGYDPAAIFYCGESVLLRSHRGHGVYAQFFAERENHARKLGRFRQCSFCCVQRLAQHALRPMDYVPLDDIWRKFGYAPQPELRTQYRWKDIDQADETPHDMMFWTKIL